MTARSAQGLGVGHLDTSHVQHCSALQATRLCHRMQQCSTGAAGTRGHHREQEEAVKFSFNICSSFWNCHEHQMNNTLLLKGPEKIVPYRYLQDMKGILWYERLVECLRRRSHILCVLVSCYGCHCIPVLVAGASAAGCWLTAPDCAIQSPSLYTVVTTQCTHLSWQLSADSLLLAWPLLYNAL